MKRIFCAYLQAVVEFSAEREQHVAQRHPDLLPRYREKIAATLSGPDEVRRSSRFGNARLFSRWFDDVREGKHVVVVVVSEAQHRSRHWVITAYLARKLAEGEIEWKRN